MVATPDLQEEDLTTEDETAILASDGLWDVVSNQDAITLIKDIKVGLPLPGKELPYGVNSNRKIALQYKVYSYAAREQINIGQECQLCILIMRSQAARVLSTNPRQ